MALKAVLLILYEERLKTKKIQIQATEVELTDAEMSAFEKIWGTSGWKAFEKRDLLNDQFCGPHWKLRVIPLWLKRVFATALRTSPKGRKDKQRLARRRRSW